MGRHYRDEEPVPHPQDRTPRVPAEGRSEASGAFRTPGRSSISDAFGIAGRATGATRIPSESSGSAFFTEGAEAPGFAPEPSGTHPARRGEASGAYPATRRGEASGSYPITPGGETTATRAPRRGEAAGPPPVATGSESTLTHAPRRGEGSYPAASRAEATATRAPRRGEAPGHPAASTETTTVFSTRVGDASGSYPAASRTEATGARPVATRKSRRGEASGVHPVTAEAPAAPRSRRKGKPAGDPHPESAAERTEVITRPDDLAVELPDDVAATARTLDRSDDTGSSRRRGRSAERSDPGTGPDRAGRSDSTGPAPAGRSEGTGSHRIVGKSDVTGSHRIVGKKAPRRRIATWPIACLVLAVLIGLGVVGWNWADNELNSRAEAQAASCDGGTSHMRVVVTPSVQKPVTAAAERWNQAATVVHGQCVHIMIEAKPSAQVLDALVGRANLDSIGGLPAAWLPESSYWVSELTTKKPEMIGSAAQSVANARSADYPFIGLAGPGIDDTVLRAAQTFREYLEQPAQQADFAAAGIKSA
ncbi:hypothetical protein [Amycolatopsis sp. A133]|uniref:hypothetical protein n=1 Tax=Amycolatopsis sp. A133 TaxID=3064472 RepID=UPI002803F8B0|nr:hypothetical protein [Amycolatopsis sp. A133]